MSNKIKVVQYGTGKMSIYTMRYVYEKGGEIVGAVDVNPNVIGKDIGEIIGTNNKGVKVVSSTDAEEMLKQTKPDIVVIETMSLISDVEDALILCAKLGINAITTCEEAFFPMNSNPTITKKIDELAKQTGCTITGSGYQDIYWGQLISSIAGSTQRITKIKGSSSYNVEDYGIALAKAHGAGLTLDAFDKEIAAVDKISDEERQKLIENGEYLPSYMWNVNGWLCEKLGLTVKSQTQKTVPQTYKEDIYSETLQMTVKAGDATGMSAIVTTETEEGILIESECIGKVYSKEDIDKNEWTIEGEPSTTIVVNRPNTVELTCATIVNRIPDVINAKAGYVPTEEIGELNYKSKELDKYVK
ncbi:MAG: dihydrodipicolinate reductase [Clostridia bacterium]|nr:dihydrodipicolinate reductase [Clostridia bacterium]MBP3802077.1 dihydrodipicolinate reductase [Clostridia bacterium]